MISRRKKTIVGVVVNDKMDKTVVVASNRLTRHVLYKKQVKKRAKYKVHDKNNQCKVGDKVLIVESRPLSKHKRWRIREVVEESVII